MNLNFVGAEVLRPQGLSEETLSIEGPWIASPTSGGRTIDLSGFRILPGIVDVHGDGFERHLAPRRGAMKQMAEGLIATEAELAANGITTAVLAQFVSWEGGLRGYEFAHQVFSALRDTKPKLVTDLIGQLRLETHLLDLYSSLPKILRDWDVNYVVFNDHLPHDRLAAGRTPKRMVGQALKAGRNPDAHLRLMQDLHAQSDQVPVAINALCAKLSAQGVLMGSHDVRSADDQEIWHQRNVTVAEFPETNDAATAAKSRGNSVVLGAPNVVRGGSHNGNVSALDLVAMGQVDALASDYHYPSPRRAALMIWRSGLLDLPAAWHLVSTGPAMILGLHDRGTLTVGKRADLVFLETQTDRVAATMSNGKISFMNGEIFTRFMW